MASAITWLSSDEVLPESFLRTRSAVRVTSSGLTFGPSAGFAPGPIGWGLITVSTKAQSGRYAPNSRRRCAISPLTSPALSPAQSNRESKNVCFAPVVTR